MQKETEIKLRVSRETLAALREHPLLKKRNKSGWERRELFNQYFDTPARDLAEAKVALDRLRAGRRKTTANPPFSHAASPPPSPPERTPAPAPACARRS